MDIDGNGHFQVPAILLLEKFNLCPFVRMLCGSTLWPKNQVVHIFVDCS